LNNKLNPLTGQPYTQAQIEADYKIHYSLHEYEEYLRECGIRLLPSYKKPDHTRTVNLDMKFQGSLVKVGIRGLRNAPPPAKRGKVTGFSHASRRRMMETMMRLKHVKNRVFVTLTYGDFPTPIVAKQHLRAFLERVRRRYDHLGVSAVWRMELQEKRGAPHFHLMFFNLPFWSKDDLQKTWGEVIGQERPFTRIEFIYSWRGVLSYVSKYMTKQDSGEAGHGGFNYVSYPHDLGRVWGIFNRKYLPLDALIHVVLPFMGKFFHQFRDLACSVWPELAQREHPGFSLYVKNAHLWYNYWQEIFDTPF